MAAAAAPVPFSVGKSSSSNKTSYPSGSIDKSRVRSNKFIHPFKELNVPSHIQDEVYLAAFLSCWICKFVFPSKDVGFIRPSTFKVASMMAAGRQFSLAIPVLAIEAKVSPPMNVVNDRLFLPLTCISEFNHANHTTSAVKAVKKLTLQLLPSINRARLQVSVPVKGITFQGTNELFDHEITISPSIVASLHKNQSTSFMLFKCDYHARCTGALFLQFQGV
uniref:Aminotransferase-like plant mobile domain-containing protein n=1 Tax=Salix viminalis TaxID=40686 RepID=A0A6N2KY82_SALVM